MRNFAVLAGLMLSVAIYTFYADYAAQPAQKEKQAAPRTVEALQAAPDFSFSDLSGKQRSLSDFKGKTIVLNFWAPWCAPCAKEFPQMVTLARYTKDESVFLFLSVEEDKKQIAQFLKKYAKDGLPSNVITGTDKDMHVSQQLFQTYGLPETYLIGPDLKISQKIIGDTAEWESPAMTKKIKAISAQK